ncbi:MAG TPA: hypothetical protein VLX11_08665, partial [Candidatus Acidoferrales bacterium]|nr:hypothetical protein [Candidatus Acidoferrales bacterium]
PRARAGAPVSMPVGWEELSDDLRSQFAIANTYERLKRLRSDPWQDYEASRITLTKAMLDNL